MPHGCPCLNCARSVRDEYLMCPQHWRRVSKATQRIIWATCGVSGSIAAYQQAVSDALLEIAKKEGIEVPLCRKCGCWELHACPGGCFWVETDLCSACASPEQVEAFLDQAVL